jgi:hypothetical protein
MDHFTLIDISDLVTLATQRAADLGVLRNSFTKGAGNIYGFLGELAFRRYFGLPMHGCFSFDFDVEMGGATWEIKTKRCTSQPRINYCCSVSAHNHKQECDYYCFMRVHQDQKRAWLMGAISREGFQKKAVFLKEGERDIYGFTCKCDSWNVFPLLLKHPTELLCERGEAQGINKK